jgi:hypothetical protein
MSQLAAGHPVSGRTGNRVAIVLLLAVAGCAEPFIVMSGKALSGTVVDPPADWTELGSAEVAQLEAQPSDPYSVNIWFVARGSDIYVATGDDDTNWSVMIDHDPDVRLRIGSQVYELEASRVGDSREKRDVAAQYVSKYDLDPEDNWVLDGQVFRLDRR